MPATLISAATGELIGRASEVAAIRTAVTDPSPGLMVEGPAGIGKTSVWAAGVRFAIASGATVLATSASEAERRLSFVGLDDLLGAVLARVLTEIPRTHGRTLEAALLRPGDAPAEPDGRAVGAAVLSALRALTRETRLVIALDDIQWLDPGSMKALAFALRRLEPSGLTVLATRRTGEGRVEPLQRALDERSVERMDLVPMDEAAIAAIIRQRLGARLSRPTHARVFELCGGNPLFAIELARAAHGTPSAWLGSIPIPNELASTVRRRLRSLQAPVGDVLAAAALTARPSVQLIVSATGLEADTVLDAIDQADRADVAGLVPEGPAQPDVVRFRHPLFRSVAAELLRPADVRTLHRRLAEAIADPEERGRHFAASTTGPDERVAWSLDRAAAHARARGALDAAAELWGLAASATPLDAEHARTRRLIKAAISLHDAGDRPGGEALIRSSLDTVPAGPLRAKALTALAIMRWNQLREGTELLDLAEREAGGDPWTRARVLATRAWVDAYGGSLGSAERRADEALALAERSGQPAVRGALALCAWVRALQGRDSLPYLERGMALGDVYVHGDHCTPRLSAAMAHRWIGDLPQARALLEAEDRSILAIGSETARIEPLGPLAEVAWRLGAWEAAERAIGELSDLAEDSGVAASRTSQWAQAEALVAIGYGHLDRGIAVARAGADAAHEVGDRFSEAHARAALVFGFLVAGHAEAAVTEFRLATSIARELGVREPGVLGVMGDGAEALAATSAMDELAALVDLLSEAAADGTRPWAMADAARARAFLVVSADLEEAERSMTEAITGYRHLAMPFEVARCNLTLGGWLRRQRRQREAREVLEGSRCAFERLGAALWSGRAERELGKIGGRAPAPASMTTGEEAVVALVMQGRTNKEVAEHLHLSVRTVESHLTRIYRKYGVRSRAELIVRIRGQEAPIAADGRTT